MPTPSRPERVIVFGAGPAGLTAAYEAVQTGCEAILFEGDSQVGGISKTVDYHGYLFDIGGHRYFTKISEIKKICQDILGREFLIRSRLSIIYNRNRLFHYPADGAPGDREHHGRGPFGLGRQRGGALP